MVLVHPLHVPEMFTVVPLTGVDLTRCPFQETETVHGVFAVDRFLGICVLRLSR